MDLTLLPGAMSRHNIWIVHGFAPNLSKDSPRIGIATRDVSAAVKPDSPRKPLATLVRGRNAWGTLNFCPLRRIATMLMSRQRTPRSSSGFAQP